MYAMAVALFFQHPIGRGMMIQILAITRLELLLHSRHPDILDQLTGDPEQDKPLWQNLEEREQLDVNLTATNGAAKTIGSTITNGKVIGGYVPCQESKQISTIYPSLSIISEQQADNFEKLKKYSVAPYTPSLETVTDLDDEKNEEFTAF